MVAEGKGLLELPQKIVYYEKQGADRMCGAHVVNMLLQRPSCSIDCFRKAAQRLDEQESMLMGENPVSQHVSENQSYDGFFNVTVLEAVLESHDLRIARLSADKTILKQYPHRGEGFLINVSQHWFCFRRIKGHWYRLDSLKDSPTKMSDPELDQEVLLMNARGGTVFVVNSTKHASMPLSDVWCYDIPAARAKLGSDQFIDVEEVKAEAKTLKVEHDETGPQDIQLALTIRQGSAVRRAIKGFADDSTIGCVIQWLVESEIGPSKLTHSVPPRKAFNWNGSAIEYQDKPMSPTDSIRNLLSSEVTKNESFNVSAL